MAASGLHWFAGWVHTPFAQELVQQVVDERQAVPAGSQVAVETQVFPAQPSDSPAQQSVGRVQEPERCEQAGAWQVRVPAPAGQTRPTQQSPSPVHGALALPQVGGGVQVPFVHESELLQQGTVGEQAPLVAPQVAGGTQVVVPSRSGSTHESAPLQQGTVPVHCAPVAAQAAGGVQRLFVQESAPLQQGTDGGEQVLPLPAQTAGAVHLFGVPVQPSAGLQQSASVVQVEPVPAHAVGFVQTLLPTAPAHAPARPLQQSESCVQAEPVPAQAAGTVHFPPAQTFSCTQQGSEAQEAPVAAQVGGGGGGGVPPDDFPLQAPRARAAASARTACAGRKARDMDVLPEATLPEQPRENHRFA